MDDGAYVTAPVKPLKELTMVPVGTGDPFSVKVVAEMLPVEVVLPSAEKENVAAWLIAGAASLRMKVEADPLTAERPTLAEGFAPVAVEHVAHAIVMLVLLVVDVAMVSGALTANEPPSQSEFAPTHVKN